jgi:hypothetical protein
LKNEKTKGIYLYQAAGFNHRRSAARSVFFGLNTGGKNGTYIGDKQTQEGIPGICFG